MRPLLNLILILSLFASCKRAQENPEPVVDPITGEPAQSGSFTFQFQLMNGSQPLVFEKDYINAAGETYQIQHFKFFISNIVLSKPDGSTYSVPESYFLVHPQVRERVKVDNIPLGSYSQVSFIIGIDSARNVSGVQRGALDPAMAPDMFWEWRTGYVFLMLNGTSPVSSTSGNYFQYHISGFRKEDNALQTIASPFNSETLDIKQNAIPNLHYYVKMEEFFKNPQNISIAQKSIVISPGSDAMMISQNYRDMFKLQHIEK